jgi:hypothetical protein
VLGPHAVEFENALAGERHLEPVEELRGLKRTPAAAEVPSVAGGPTSISRSGAEPVDRVIDAVFG